MKINVGLCVTYTFKNYWTYLVTVCAITYIASRRMSFIAEQLAYNIMF